MLSREQIEEKLRALRFKDDDLTSVVRDVEQVVLGRAANILFKDLPEAEQQHLLSLDPAEIEKYFQTHAAPTISQESFAELHDRTWEDYFNSIGNSK